MKVLMLNYEFPPLGGGGSNACKYIFLKPNIRRVWKNAAAVIANSQGLKDLTLKTDKDVKN
jgi:hypothetical protein